MININLIYATILGIFVGGVAGYLGSLMLTKRMALVGGAFGHLALPGIALALVYGFDVSLGALIFLSFGMVFVWLIERKSVIPMEALSAVVFTGSLSVAWLFLPEDRRASALIGDVSKVNFNTLLIFVLVSLVVFFIIASVYKKMILFSISEDVTASLGINLKKYNFIYLAAIVIVIALGVRIIGGLMTAALVAIPAATGRNISRSIFGYSVSSLLFGAFATSGGIFISPFVSIPAGPLIVIISITLFMFSLIFKKG